MMIDEKLHVVNPNMNNFLFFHYNKGFFLHSYKYIKINTYHHD